MIDRLEILVSRLRYRLSRTAWSARLLGHVPQEGHETDPGLILLQIDGLGEADLRQALAENRVPFLRRLIEQDGYAIHPLYTGLPSNGAGFQGELFYGIPGCAPASRFLDRATGRLVALSDVRAAADLETRVAAGRRGLLAGGSVWSTLFTGGADERHLCAATIGVRETLRALAPGRLALYLLWHGWSVARAVTNALAVSLLAAWDVGRGRMSGAELLGTLRFVPLRVGASVLLREIAAIGAAVDAERGVPIVYASFVGFDENAHRRGTDSRFARWSLRGIDGAVRRVWQSAHRSRRRDYQVWILSSHGQEIPAEFRDPRGRGVEDCVRAATGGRDGVSVVVQGPFAHVYLPEADSIESRDALAETLHRKHRVPSVLAAAEAGRAVLWTGGRRHRLPDDPPRALGAAHPHAPMVPADLVQLAHHPDAGTLVLLGWSPDAAFSFVPERGSHGGPGDRETAAFALMPPEAEAFTGKPEQFRPADLRRMACRTLGRGADSAGDPDPPRRAPRKTQDGTLVAPLRIMTYNVHGCRGMDGVFSPGRIARVIAREQPDVVCLQELDQERSRSGRIDQIDLIARRLRAEYRFHAVSEVDDGRFGNAVISSFPLRMIGARALPSAPRAKSMFHLWDRGALWVALDVGGHEVHVVNTHLSILQHERRLQAEALLGEDWLGGAGDDIPLILAGDMNAAARSWTIGRLEERLRNAVDPSGDGTALNTWTGRIPVRRIDHVLVNGAVDVERVYVPRTRLSRVASDHMPLVVDVVCRCRAGSERVSARDLAALDRG